MQAFFDRLLTVSVPDPDDARRRRLLNILVLGIVVSALLGLLAFVVDALTTRSLTGLEARTLLASIGIFIVGMATIYYVNRRSGRWAAFMFLLVLTIAFSFSDTPDQLAHGRSIFVYTFPVAISSLILFPAASFILAAISSAIIGWLAISSSTFPNSPAIIGFFMLALVSWLSSRGLEQALQELRETNANLDRLVSERTQALAESLARERIEAGRRQAILNSIADGVIVFNQSGEATQANPALAQLLNLPQGLTSGSISDLLQSENLSANSRELLTSLIKRPAQTPSSLRVDWGKKTLSISAAEVRDSNSENIGTVAVFRDFTREAELERMKSTFVAIVSHELRTPLNAIMGYAEMLREAVYGPVNERQAVASERIMTNTLHMLGMVGELLDQAQMEAGKLKIKEQAFKPAELLDNLHTDMDKVAADKGLTLISNLESDMPESLEGDPLRLQQIIVNLVNNAIKFTDHGTIQVRLFRASKDNWGIEVKDDGRGIPQEEVSHIFDSFHQVDSTTTREHSGFGLGLSIVKQLVGLMKGEIDVHSEPGKGSTFAITLPLISLDRKEQAMGHLALVIEDDMDLIEIFDEALKAAGYDTEMIRDGAAARQRLNETKPEVVVLDMHLPYVDGSLLLTQIRDDGRLKGTTVIVATADALMGDMYRDMADYVLIKPISFTQLRDLSARLRPSQ